MTSKIWRQMMKTAYTMFVLCSLCIGLILLETARADLNCWQPNINTRHCTSLPQNLRCAAYNMDQCGNRVYRKVAEAWPDGRMAAESGVTTTVSLWCYFEKSCIWDAWEARCVNPSMPSADPGDPTSGHVYELRTIVDDDPRVPCLAGNGEGVE